MIRHGLMLLALLLLLPAPSAADGLMVVDAWVRQPPPNTSAAAYLTLHNHGKAARTLRAVESDCCARVEIHRTVVADGVARMEPVPEVEAPAGGQVHFAPRGLHLMLIEPGALEPGDEVGLRLRFADGETLEIAAPIRKAGSDAKGHQGHHDEHAGH